MRAVLGPYEKKHAARCYKLGPECRTEREGRDESWREEVERWLMTVWIRQVGVGGEGRRATWKQALR